HVVPAGANVVPTQTVLAQVSPNVQALPSSHAVPGTTGVPPQMPPEQTSLVVHSLKSSQAAVWGTGSQVPMPLHALRQTLPGGFGMLKHRVAGGRKPQVTEQQSLGGAPTSQSSWGSTTPLPHLVPVAVPPGTPALQEKDP